MCCRRGAPSLADERCDFLFRRGHLRADTSLATYTIRPAIVRDRGRLGNALPHGGHARAVWDTFRARAQLWMQHSVSCAAAAGVADSEAERLGGVQGTLQTRQGGSEFRSQEAMKQDVNRF